MSPEEIARAQSPIHGWDRESRAFHPTAGIDSAPRWTDFDDPLEAIGARAREFRERAHAVHRPGTGGRHVSGEERRALEVLGLSIEASRTDLRQRYSELVRRYHPDRNGGDRSHEARLQGVVEAYQLLRKTALFA